MHHDFKQIIDNACYLYDIEFKGLDGFFPVVIYKLTGYYYYNKGIFIYFNNFNKEEKWQK